MSARDLSASAASGLVSVPTTPTGGKDQRLCTADRISDAAAMQKALGAFRIDPKATMLPRLRRAVGFSARAHAASRKGHRSDQVWMLTLTYRGVDDWRSDHLTRCMDRLRLWCKRDGKVACRYVWVAELQLRGAIHYHVAVWLPRGVIPPKPDAAGWWPHGMSNRMKATHATGYLMSYLKKGSHDGKFPAGSRRYGVGGLDHSLRRARRWLGLPAFVQSSGDIYADWRRAVGGGWASPHGQLFPSEFQRVFVADSWCLQRVARHDRPFEAAGPYTALSSRELALSLS